VRSRLVAECTNLINQMRAILLECAPIFSAGRCKLELGLDALAEDEAPLAPRVRQLVAELCAKWRELDTKIAAPNGEFVEMARNDQAMHRLTSIHGVGILNPTAPVAAWRWQQIRQGSESRCLAGARAASARHAASQVCLASPSAGICTCECCSFTAPERRGHCCLRAARHSAVGSRQ
jgi:hypothetical protein